MNEGINLGDVVRDSITGFEGVVIGMTDWLYGCRTLTVRPLDLKDGRPNETVQFDEPQVVLVKAAKRPEPARRTGGPRPEPTMRESATRPGR